MSDRIAGLLALLLGLGGCSVLTDLSEFSPDPPTDASADLSLSTDSSGDAENVDSSTDSAPFEASADAEPAEAGPDSAEASTDSGPADATSDGEAGPDDAGEAGPTKTFCEQLASNWGYTYCRDFDDAEPFEFNWDNRVIEPGGELLRDTNAFSLPACFLANMAPPDAGTCVNAYAAKNVAGASDHSSLVFRLRMGSMDEVTAFAGSFMSLRYTGGTEPCSLVMYGDGQSGLVLEDTATPTSHPFTVRFPLQYEWTKVELSVDRIGRTFDVLLDGQSAFSAPQSLSADCSVEGSVFVVPGVVCSSELPAASGEVRIDNIVYND